MPMLTVGSARLVIMVSAMIPRISSITAAPKIALPARVLSFPISLSVSTEMLTDVAVRMTPTKTFCSITIVSLVPSVGLLKKYVSAEPPSKGTITPIRAMIKDALPVFFSSRTSVSRPAVNIRIITPSSAICVINSVSVSTLSMAGPSTRPATSAPTTWGILNRLVTSPNTFVVRRIKARSKRK